jgi:hypothetical protein
MSRRRFLAAGVAAAGALALGNAGCDPAIMRRLRQATTRVPQHAVWIWQFSIDGPAQEIAGTLAAYGLSAIVKTHDGVEWMAKYDPVDGAIAGPAELETIAATFENAGVPFHAWCVVKGTDIAREVEMASQVLDAGARSLVLDVEEGESFWQGTADDARRFGYELRLRHEFARIDITIDPRPWKMLALPIPEFAEFADGIRPQLYWDLFGGYDHANAYQLFGFTPPAEGVTPDFMLQTAKEFLAPFDRWILPVGPGSVDDPDAWGTFLRHCNELQMPEASVWRYGTVSGRVLGTLADHPA